MTRLDQRERRVALWASVFGAASAVGFYAPAFGEYTAAIVLALIGVAMAGLLALASRSSSRLLTCLASGLLGIGPWGYAYIIGLPFLVLAGWLLYRDANTRRARGWPARERPVKERPAKEPPVNERPVTERPVKKRRLPKRRVTERPAREKPSGQANEKSSRPAASRRYTPPAGRR